MTGDVSALVGTEMDITLHDWPTTCYLITSVCDKGDTAELVFVRTPWAQWERSVHDLFNPMLVPPYQLTITFKKSALMKLKENT